jgi:hypothetical protein
MQRYSNDRIIFSGAESWADSWRNRELPYRTHKHADNKCAEVSKPAANEQLRPRFRRLRDRHVRSSSTLIFCRNHTSRIEFNGIIPFSIGILSD